MEMITLSIFILAIFAMEGRPLRLTEICRRIKDRTVSKPTVYRHLQKLVAKGILSQKEEKYVLVRGGDLAIKATDFARISELKPIMRHTQKGLSLGAYGSKDMTSDFDREALEADFKRIMEKHLCSIDPDLKGIFVGKPLTKDALKKLVGMKFALIASFNGTDFSTLTSTEEILNKTKEIVKILAETDGVTIQELSNRLNLNEIEVRQAVDPLLASGLAKMDETGKIEFVVEVKPGG